MTDAVHATVAVEQPELLVLLVGTDVRSSRVRQNAPTLHRTDERALEKAELRRRGRLGVVVHFGVLEGDRDQPSRHRPTPHGGDPRPSVQDLQAFDRTARRCQDQVGLQKW